MPSRSYTSGQLIKSKNNTGYNQIYKPTTTAMLKAGDVIQVCGQLVPITFSTLFGAWMFTHPTGSTPKCVRDYLSTNRIYRKITPDPVTVSVTLKKSRKYPGKFYGFIPAPTNGTMPSSINVTYTPNP